MMENTRQCWKSVGERKAGTVPIPWSKSVHVQKVWLWCNNGSKARSLLKRYTTGTADKNVFENNVIRYENFEGVLCVQFDFILMHIT